MGVHQNNLDSVEILRIDKGSVMYEVNMYLYTTLQVNHLTCMILKLIRFTGEIKNPLQHIIIDL